MRAVWNVSHRARLVRLFPEFILFPWLEGFEPTHRPADFSNSRIEQQLGVWTARSRRRRANRRFHYAGVPVKESTSLLERAALHDQVLQFSASFAEEGTLGVAVISILIGGNSWWCVVQRLGWPFLTFYYICQSLLQQVRIELAEINEEWMYIVYLLSKIVRNKEISLWNTNAMSRHCGYRTM